MYQSANIFNLNFKRNVNNENLGYKDYANYYLFNNSNDCCKFIKKIKVSVSNKYQKLPDFVCIIYKCDKNENVPTKYEDILNKTQVIDIGVPVHGVYEFNKQDTLIDMQNKNLCIFVLNNAIGKVLLCKNISYE